MKVKEQFTSLKKYWQIIYSAVLIVLVPVVIIVNTIWVTNSFRSNIDTLLQRQALGLGETINATLQDDLNNPEKLQESLMRVAEMNPDIRFADILIAKGEEFEVVASTNPEKIGESGKNILYSLTWLQEQATANINAFEDERFWAVSVPLVDEKGEKQALLSLHLSLSIMDALVAETLFASGIVLVVAVIIVVLVLIANTRLFQYAILAKKLKEVEQLKDEFISMASHELRTPITAIRGYLSLMAEGSMGKMSDQATEKVKMMVGSADRLNELVDDLLNVSRIEQGRLKLELKDIDIVPVVEGVMAELKVQADNKKLVFMYDKPHEPLPKLNLDPQRLKQVLVNIIGNAIKYTPKGSVTITTVYRPEDKVVEIKCADTGLGMTQKQREKLFQKFYRVKTEQTSKIKGTGLGLWITKQLIEMMKGEILVDSIKDVGTQMTINFPVPKN